MTTIIPQGSGDFQTIIMDGIITILITPTCISTMVLLITTVLV